MRIRQGNDFIFLWAIERSGEPEDFSNAVNIRLHFKNLDYGEVKSFQIVEGNIVRVEVSPEWASQLGTYRLILSYEFEDLSYSDGNRKCVVDVLAFNIVPKTSDADDVTEMAKTTDIMIGLKGDKGDPFTYDDFTAEQIEDLKRPAIEAAEDATVKIENLIVNGNFRDGLSGWGGSGTLVNGKLKLKTSVIEQPEFASNSYVSDWAIGNKIYSFIKVDIIDGYEVTGSKYIMLRVGDSGSAGNFCFFSKDDVLPKGIKTFSSITIADKAGQLFYGIYVRDSFAEVDFLNVINIDLTKTFGAGNEPTKDEMELLISTLGIEYFEGETTIPAQIIMQWQLKLIRRNKNAIIALGGTII